MASLLFRRRHRIATSGEAKSSNLQGAFLAQFFQLGYTFANPEGYRDELVLSYEALIEQAREKRGGHVEYVPLFAKFPNDVPEQNEHLAKRLIGFVLAKANWDVPMRSLGPGLKVPEWLFDLEVFGADPVSQRQVLGLYLKQLEGQLKRLSGVPGRPTSLRFVDSSDLESELGKWLSGCLRSKVSVPEPYREDIDLALSLLDDFQISREELVFREHLALYSSFLWREQRDEKLSDYMTCPTDILRLLAHLSNSDVSLAEKITFPALNRRDRRRILGLLNDMTGPVLGHQLLRYRGLWLALERSLHSGEYANLFPHAHQALRRLQKGEWRPRFSELESALGQKSEGRLRQELARQTGGVVLRRFQHALSVVPEREFLDFLMSKIEGASFKDLLVLRQTIARDAELSSALVLTKRGTTQIIPRDPTRLDPQLRQSAIESLDELIGQKIRARFYQDWAGKSVYVQPELEKYTVPLSLRSASDGLRVLGRGSRVPISDKPVIRFFIYWHQRFERTDLDLSCLSFDADFRCVGQVSWTNLKSQGMVHSGDIVSAPLGAAEFIDVKLDRLKALGHRYVAMLVYRYCGEHFGDMTCLAGWMERAQLDANYKSFDITTVEQKICVSGEAKFAIPALLDLETREVLWVDLRAFGNTDFNQVESSWRRLQSMLKAVVDSVPWRLNLKTLAELHARHRGATLCENPSEADVVFTSNSGDYSPQDWNTILSELL